MVRFQTWTAGCLILIGAGLALFNPGTAQSQAPQNVLVTNTTSQPVPVSKSGTWNVGISGVPTVKLDATTNTVKLDATTNTVKAAQSGVWSVGLSAAGNTVRVGNAKSSPVPTYDALDAKTPFQASLFSNGSLTVPAGKRLVIEYVGILAYTIPPGIAYSPKLITTAGGVTSPHTFGLVNVGTTGGFTFFQSGQATRICADPNTTVSWTLLSYNGDLWNSEVTLSGYLVAYP